MFKESILITGIMAALIANSAIAEQVSPTKQTTTPEPSTMKTPAEPAWEVNWTPYIWATTLEADITQGAASGGGALSFGEIVDRLEMTYMHTLEINKGRWGIYNDIIYFHLSDDKDGPAAGIVNADIDMTQTIVDLAGTYRATEDGNTTLFAGLRYIELDVRIKTSSNIPSLNKNLSNNESWTNVLLGVRQNFPINNKLSFIAKGDIAADFSDEMSYILTAGVNYKMTDLLDLKFGYRYAGIDYKNGPFEFDEIAQGAFTGLTFKW